MTAALEGGEWLAARPGRTLPQGKTWYPLYRRLGGPQGWSGRAKNLVPTRIISRTVQPAVSRYTDWATRPTDLLRCRLKTHDRLRTHYYIFKFILAYCLLGVSLQVSPDLSNRSQRFSPPRTMCAVLISVIFGSSMADVWPGSNWRF